MGAVAERICLRIKGTLKKSMECYEFRTNLNTDQKDATSFTKS